MFKDLSNIFTFIITPLIAISTAIMGWYFAFKLNNKQIIFNRKLKKSDLQFETAKMVLEHSCNALSSIRSYYSTFSVDINYIYKYTTLYEYSLKEIVFDKINEIINIGTKNYSTIFDNIRSLYNVFYSRNIVLLEEVLLFKSITIIKPFKNVYNMFNDCNIKLTDNLKVPDQTVDNNIKELNNLISYFNGEILPSINKLIYALLKLQINIQNDFLSDILDGVKIPEIFDDKYTNLQDIKLINK